jgi:hypothetical protein
MKQKTFVPDKEKSYAKLRIISIPSLGIDIRKLGIHIRNLETLIRNLRTEICFAGSGYFQYPPKIRIFVS